MADCCRDEFRDCGGRVTGGIRGIAAIGNKDAAADRTDRGEGADSQQAAPDRPPPRDLGTACLPVTVLSRSMQAVGSRCTITSLLSHFPHKPIIGDGP